MADIPANPSSWTPKDFVVVLPFFGSATAVCWEVGSFVPIGRGAFSMFSLSEHPLFALQALRIALVQPASWASTRWQFEQPLSIGASDLRAEEKLDGLVAGASSFVLAWSVFICALQYFSRVHST